MGDNALSPLNCKTKMAYPIHLGEKSEEEEKVIKY